MIKSPSRLFMSGDWWVLGAWIVAAVAGFLVSIQPGMTDDQAKLLTFAVLSVALGIGWLVERITRRPILRMAPKERGMGATGVGVVLFLVWGIVFAILGSYLPLFDPLAPVGSMIVFMGGWQVSRLAGRAVDLRNDRRLHNPMT